MEIFIGLGQNDKKTELKLFTDGFLMKFQDNETKKEATKELKNTLGANCFNYLDMIDLEQFIDRKYKERRIKNKKTSSRVPRTNKNTIFSGLVFKPV